MQKTAHFMILVHLTWYIIMKNIAIFASGQRRTNAENIGRYFANSDKVKVAVVLSNNRHVGVHARVTSITYPFVRFSREEFVEGTPIIAKLKEYHIDLIVLAGFMNKISNVLLEAYPHRIINIHPALLRNTAERECTECMCMTMWLPATIRNPNHDPLYRWPLWSGRYYFPGQMSCSLMIRRKMWLPKCMPSNMRTILTSSLRCGETMTFWIPAFPTSLFRLSFRLQSCGRQIPRDADNGNGNIRTVPAPPSKLSDSRRTERRRWHSRCDRSWTDQVDGRMQRLRRNDLFQTTELDKKEILNMF